jgi:SAM-dependent methyltransferase
MTQNYTLSSTKAYHEGQLNTLGWELTVCNALYPEGTPLRKLLTRNESFGCLLYDYLSQFLPMKEVIRVLEVGGGYGYLMKDFLEKDRSLKACMLDISTVLLEKQREALKAFPVEFRKEDFLETQISDLSGFDLAIMNENLGDFPTLINLDRDIFHRSIDHKEAVLRWAERHFESYGLELPQDEVFNLNIGAIEALEKLCVAGVPHIYLGEHSCEASVPEGLRSTIRLESTGNPEKISLTGHDEYTIKFSYLVKIAAFHGYRSIRGPFADFIPVEMSDEARFALTYGGNYSDEAEMISQFIEDLYRYEYLILTKKETAI